MHGTIKHSSGGNSKEDLMGSHNGNGHNYSGGTGSLRGGNFKWYEEGTIVYRMKVRLNNGAW